MSLKLGDVFPNFTLKTTVGEFQLHEWLGDKFVDIDQMNFFSTELI